LVEVILKAIPNAPAYTHYRSVEDAVRALNPNATPAQFAEVRALANDRDLKEVLWMGDIMDTGDSSYAVYTGIRSALNFFFGDKSVGLENDDQQRNDAVLKALGLAYMTYYAFPGSMAEKLAAFKSNPAAQTMAIYYGAAEVALPFTDNALTGGSSMVSSLWSKYGSSQVSRLAGLMKGKSTEDATSTLNTLMNSLDQVTATASRYTTPIAAAAKQYVPGVVSGADKVAGVVAAGADMLPIYRLLSARLAAESAAQRALATR